MAASQIFLGAAFIFLPKNFTKKFLKFWDKVGKFSLLKLYSILRGKDKNIERMNKMRRRKDNEFDDEMEFKIVGATEANSLKGKISNESPLGKALIGAKKGDVVTVEAPAGIIEYTILDIYKPE